MSKGPQREFCRDFCAQKIGQLELLFLSNHGGLPPAICGDCATGFAEVVRLYRSDPAAAHQAVAAHNAAIRAAA